MLEEEDGCYGRGVDQGGGLRLYMPQVEQRSPPCSELDVLQIKNKNN